MRPDQRELDDEIQGHLALSIKERIERGEDPKAARLGALQEFGDIPDARESMRRVWYSRWFDAAANFVQDVRIGFRSLWRAKGLSVAVIVTLALGIGANAAIFSVVRGVLLRPLVNRDENRLVYIRQSAPGFGTDNMTFSVPEIADFKSRVTSIGAFGDFSVVEFTMLGLGDPRVVRAGVVSGSYFDVMGLRPVLGRLLDAGDDGPDAASVAVLTYGFWTTWLKGDPSVVGKKIRLGIRNTIVVGVLEPSVPYPTQTEIIANVVTSPHHQEATMVTGRTHRMTELFGRLVPGATVESARTELTAVHSAMMHEHPEAYSAKADVRLTVTPLRDQITAPARTILILLLAAAAVVFVIACSNVANLLLARSVRREGELTVRAALGASHGALRRTLLAESLVLCGAGALLGLAVARPLVGVVAQFASRFSVRALEVTVDYSVLWVGAGLAIAAAVLLAYIPRLPTTYAATGFGLATAPRGTGGGPSGLRITPGNNRRLRVFATIQIAFSFVLLAGAGALIATLMAMRTAPTGYEMRQVLVLDVPPSVVGASREPTITFVREATRRVRELPGVQGVATSSFAPWRDARDSTFPHFQFAVEGYTPANGDENPHGRLRIVSPNFFAVLGVPLIAGRDFTDADDGKEPVAIVSQSVAQRLFPHGDILNRKFRWTDPLFREMHACRIVGVVADVDDEHVVGGPALTIYQPVRQMGYAARMFVRAAGDPHALEPAIRKTIREVAPNQPVEHPATLEEIRADVLSPERLNAVVLTGFAGVALLIAAVGVAGVLAFSVSARMHEFGVRLAIGLAPRQLLMLVLREGVLIVMVGITAGTAAGYASAGVAAQYVESIQRPGALPLVAAAAVLVGAAVVASLMPAARAARVDVLQALRSE
ncbi:MAG: ADOP family duplicated permease [Acidobacteriota bacterium]